MATVATSGNQSSNRGDQWQRNYLACTNLYHGIRYRQPIQLRRCCAFLCLNGEDLLRTVGSRAKASMPSTLVVVLRGRSS